MDCCSVLLRQRKRLDLGSFTPLHLVLCLRESFDQPPDISFMRPAACYVYWFRPVGLSTWPRRIGVGPRRSVFGFAIPFPFHLMDMVASKLIL